VMLCLEPAHSNLVLVGFICRRSAAIQWPMSATQWPRRKMVDT